MIRIFYIFLFSALVFSNNVKVEVDREQINENDSVTLTISSQNSKNCITGVRKQRQKLLYTFSDSSRRALQS